METSTFIQADVRGSRPAGVSLHVGLTGHEVDLERSDLLAVGKREKAQERGSDPLLDAMGKI